MPDNLPSSSQSKNHTNSDDEENLETLPLSLLFKFIRPFNGNRNELTTFIQNCNSAFQMAQPNQTDRLFLYVAAQLSTDFFKRLEKLKNECITAEQNQCENPDDVVILKPAIQRTALRRFILHCKPEISQMLRARDIKTLNESFSLALHEEKVLSYTKPNHKKYTNSNYCSFCKMNNHSTQNCRRKRNTQPSATNNANNSNSN